MGGGEEGGVRFNAIDINGDGDIGVKDKDKDKEEGIGGQVRFDVGEDQGYFSYFDKNYARTWAGPEHWRVPITRNNVGGDEEGEKGKKKKQKNNQEGEDQGVTKVKTGVKSKEEDIGRFVTEERGEVQLDGEEIDVDNDADLDFEEYRYEASENAVSMTGMEGNIDSTNPELSINGTRLELDAFLFIYFFVISQDLG
ncbi:hypothetical protein AX774_g384 [Zancudomyces culisetae]|uniref:Uncharacterized protein n=1 Tax=Zancudomyces culisetae TaxID=1213189 RepID=A0A1R1PYM7_ZANCU|nr:hypothetical protein AX774_g384 [Zancudomyces culisetae]|eukprot:OMH86068.1 hypothetical protein AX774_g384 [Zancudomyces culisetae]